MEALDAATYFPRRSSKRERSGGGFIRKQWLSVAFAETIPLYVCSTNSRFYVGCRVRPGVFVLVKRLRTSSSCATKLTRRSTGYRQALWWTPNDNHPAVKRVWRSNGHALTHVTHMTTRPPWRLATSSAPMVVSTSSRQKQRLEPSPRQLQCSRRGRRCLRPRGKHVCF